MITGAILAEYKLCLFYFPAQPVSRGQVGRAKSWAADSRRACFSNLAQRLKIGPKARLIDA
jgi:hypothetical protein